MIGGENVKICVKKSNRDGSAGRMKSVGVGRIFKRSEGKHGLKYTIYLGDEVQRATHLS